MNVPKDTITYSDNIATFNTASPFFGYIDDGDITIDTPYYQIGAGDNSYLDIITKKTRRYNQLNVTGIRLELKFKNPNFNNIELWLKNCLDELLNMIAIDLNARSNDMIGFIFSNTNNVKSHFSISFRRFSQFNSELILYELENVIQSNSLFFLDDNLIVNIDHVAVPVGYGRRTYIGKSDVEFFKIHKRSIFNPDLKPIDNHLCLAVSIVAGMAYTTGDMNKYNRLTYNLNYEELVNESRILCQKAGVSLSDGGGIHQLIKLQNMLGHSFRITVFSSRDGKNVFFKACHTNYEYCINLLLDNEHYSLILSPTAVFATAYFCTHCSVSYSSMNGHASCVIKCNRCFVSPPCDVSNPVKCNLCNREYANLVCLLNHTKRNVCSQFKICSNCCVSYTVRKTREHKCGRIYCQICKEDREIRHNCFIAITKPKPTPKNGDFYIFYDFECHQSRQLYIDDTTKLQHEVMLCVSQQACDVCRNNADVDQNCSKCGKREHVFIGNDVLHQFMTYIGSIHEMFNRIILLAHNAQRYDAHFLLRYMYTNSDAWPLSEDSLIINGSKILRIKVGRYSFIDSLNFFNAPLSELPSMFSLDNNCKGHYPHFFNTRENLDYIGKMPSLHFFGVEHMKPKQHDAVMTWHKECVEKNVIFNNKVELIKYCKEDVNILRNACLKFRQILHDLTAIEPFYQVTLAGTAMNVFTSKFLKSECISIIPRNGYRFTDNQSVKAIKWIEWMAHTRKIKIKSACNGREIRIASNILVDGFSEPRTVFNFHGCYWHQCRKCFPVQFHKTPDGYGSRMSLKYDACLAQADRIRKLGYTLIEIWEHDFDAQYECNTEFNTYISSLDHLKKPPLDPRDAFTGGRTGVCKLYHHVSDNEKIHYADVTSLYPFINKYGRYPTGVPHILVGKDLDHRSVNDIDGLLNVDILPPKHLYHPVLGVKLHNKLMFILCYTCADMKNNSQCFHTDDERMIHGTFVADELRLAVAKGYTILKIYEAWEYKMIRYDKSRNESGIFSEYINTFLKLKTESSGYPSWCQSEDDRNKFIEDFYHVEGIRLDRDKISRNEGYRSLSKLLLNSLWGRLGMRQDKTKKIFVDSSDDLLNLLLNPSYEVTSFHGLTKDALLVSYKLRKDCVSINRTVNPVLAAYTTALARIHLYKYLDKLGERCLYYDTDSVIYTCKSDEEKLLTDDYLGDLTDELASYGENSYISEAVFTSEKSYAFVVKSPNKPDTIKCKVKGINLNHSNVSKINFDVMKRLVLCDQQEVITLSNNIISRTNDSHIFSTYQTYKYKMNATKRIKVGYRHINTLPFGHSNVPDI